MKIGIIGAGNIGGTPAFRLGQFGDAVSKDFQVTVRELEEYRSYLCFTRRA